MKPAQIAVLGGAVLVFAGAMYAMNAMEKPAPAPVVAAAPPRVPTVKVLVAKGNIGFGQTVNPEMLDWQEWTESTASSNFIRYNAQRDDKKEITGWIVRQPFVQGEPIRKEKLINPNGSGFMAAILPQGKRAVSTQISAETGAGGFILPNDRVDVIMTKKQNDMVSSQVVLSNIRVLAIDTMAREKEGQNTALGKTATLELTPSEVQTLAKAHLNGTLSLALRSMSDREVAAADNDSKIINIYRGIGGAEVLNCNPKCAQ